jgi:hypothetical protein
MTDAARVAARGAVPATVALLALIACTQATAQSIDVYALLQQLGGEDGCVQAQVVGVCMCGPTVCGVRVRQYVPVAFVETTKGGGDSLLSIPGIRLPGGPGTASSSLSATDNTAEAHVWNLPDLPPQGPRCMGCGVASAWVPAGATAPAPAVCGSAALVSRAIGAIAPMTSALPLPMPVPTLAYASELDAINWRTGCRDLLDPQSRGAVEQLACGVPGGELAMAAIGESACIGSWGAMRPRQMRDIGPSPILHSAKTAVRAMSIAREQIGNFSFLVDTQGKLQQVYPRISSCFRVGELPLPEPPSSSMPAVASPDGRYGWVYWRPTTCCVSLTSTARCLHLSIR